VPPPSGNDADLHALADRVEALASRVHEIDIEVRASALAVDEKSLRELRRTVEALSKRDPKFEERMTNKVDVIVDRLQTLAKTVSTTGAANAAREGDIATLRRGLDGEHARVDAAMAELRRSVDPSSIDELRRAVAALSEQKLPRKLDSRIDGLSGKVDVVAQRLDTLATTIATTAAGLAGREGDVAALRKRFEEESSRVEGVVAELRKEIDPRSVPELREAVRALSVKAVELERGHQRGLAEVSGQIETLSNRFDTLADWASTTGTFLAGRDEEIAALRTHFQDADAKLDTAVGELREAVGGLTTQVAALDDVASGDVVRALRGGIEGVSAHVEDLGRRLESTETSVATTATGYAEKEAALAELSLGFEEARGRVESLVGDLAQTLETMSTAGPDPALVERLDAVAQQVEELAGQVDARNALETMAGPDPALVERLDALAQQVEELAGQVEARDALETVAGPDPVLVERLDAVAQQVEELAGQVDARNALETMAGPDPALVERLDALAQQVEELAGQVEARDALETATPDPVLVERLDAIAQHVEELAGHIETRPAPELDEELLNGLFGRVDSLERGVEETVDNAITRVRAAWEMDRDSLVGEIDTVAGTLRAELASIEKREPDSLVEELVRRIDAVEQQRETIAAELAGASETWASQRSALGERLDEVVTQVAEAETVEEIGLLRTAIDALASRVTSSEEDLAAVAEAPLIVARLDDLNRRLESLETERSVPAVAPEPVLGDGRFRVEMRAIELRIDHAEEAARENREAVLVQLERLASRIDMRLDRLETARNPSYDASEITAGGAQVVPIRGNDV
jgi:vacuolar-type H+-ATPase subunit I/STV1